MTIHEILAKASLNYHLSPLDSGILLSLALGKPKIYILAHPEKELKKSEYRKFISFAKRRSAGEPVAYITGKKEFFGLDFLVNKNVLIPRPETELLVEKTLKKISRRSETPLRRRLNTKYKITAGGEARQGRPDTIIDVGTGSGNIIISIAKNIPEEIRKKIDFYAVDISKESLRVAKVNAKKHGVEKRIKFVQSDLLEYFSKRKIKLNNVFVVANLPYVSFNFYRKNKSNLKFEPKSALVSSRRGLEYYTRLIGDIRVIWDKNQGISILGLLEISPEQKPQMSRILKGLFPKAETKFFQDLAGKWRLAEIEILP